jgi:type IV pilus assembly protein PilE
MMYKQPDFCTDRQSGFTLIELMIVVVIVAVLASVAFPSYTQYVTRSQRQAGKNILYRLADRQEQYFIDNKQYASNLSTLGYAADTIGVGASGDITTSTDADRIYAVALANTSATSYTVVATPQLHQASKDSACGKLLLTQAGVRSVSGSSTECW